MTDTQNRNDIDRKIREALEADYGPMPDDFLEEEHAIKMALDVFKGRNRWMTVLAFVYSLIAFGFAIWCGVEFFQVDSTSPQLGSIMEQARWGMGLIISILVVSMIKLWFWLQITANGIKRDVKRIELEVIGLRNR